MLNLNVNIPIGNITITKRHILMGISLLGALLFAFFHFNIVGIFDDDDVEIKIEKKVENKKPPEPKIKRNSITLNWKETAKLNRICEKLRVKYGCQYVNVNAFHNGDSTAGGWHFSKMTCIGEGLAEDKPPQLGALKNWHTGSFSESFLECNEMEYLYVPDMREHSSPYLSKTIPEFGIYSVVYVAILDRRYVDEDGLYHMPGFISFAWDHPTDSTDVTIKDIKAMKLEQYKVQKYIIKN